MTPGIQSVPEDRFARKPVLRFVRDLAIFAIPLSIFQEVQLAGRLFLPELILLCLIPVLLWFRQGWRPGRTMLTLLLVGVFWLIGQGATDLIRETPFADWSRGISKIVFLMLNFIGMVLLLGTSRRLWILFSLGLAAGLIIMIPSQGMVLTDLDGWKFGGGYGIGLLVVTLSVLPKRMGRLWAPLAALMLFAAVSIYLGGRSLAGIALVSSGYLIFNHLSMHLAGSSPYRPAAMALALIVSGAGIFQAYQYSALSGLLGPEMKSKYEKQIRRGEGNLIRGGRTESEVSLIAIADSPVIGHGSWAKSSKYAAMAEQRAAQTGTTGVRREDNLIPTHSHLMGAWVEAGILGCLFWATLAWLCLGTLLKRAPRLDKVLPIASFALTSLLWDIPFSPFGAQARMTVALCMGLVCLLNAQE